MVRVRVVGGDSHLSMFSALQEEKARKLHTGDWEVMSKRDQQERQRALARASTLASKAVIMVSMEVDAMESQKGNIRLQSSIYVTDTGVGTEDDTDRERDAGKACQTDKKPGDSEAEGDKNSTAGGSQSVEQDE
ncbi:hypothetical protein NDU88_006015 [Pleurodeles waltl]|uniref:Uncharacterized protein n=1 Tax=Pleurodeles waltl TaxID=8319 RepID=A0AAV7TCM6_PLEWA|nr:hypothetical protein NDU88_006015 [Pleurodeles waltl]